MVLPSSVAKAIFISIPPEVLQVEHFIESLLRIARHWLGANQLVERDALAQRVHHRAAFLAAGQTMRREFYHRNKMQEAGYKQQESRLTTMTRCGIIPNTKGQISNLKRRCDFTNSGPEVHYYFKRPLGVKA